MCKGVNVQRCKTHFIKWLWEKVRLPNVNKMYSPNYLIENDLDLVLDNWK